MISTASELSLGGALKATVTKLANGSTHVVVHTQETLLTFRVVPDSSTGLRLEQFEPEEADPRLSIWLNAVLPVLLAPMDWQYVVALYPSPWRDIFEKSGFQYLSECIHWEIALEPETQQSASLPEGIQIRPLTSSAERLGELMSSAENNPLITPRRATEFCQAILRGAYGPLIEAGSREISIQGELSGACLFTNYYGEALLAHIFIAHPRQGHGFASTLLRYALDNLARSGYARAIASTDTTNLNSRRMHARVGFTETAYPLSCGLLEKANWQDGRKK